MRWPESARRGLDRRRFGSRMALYLAGQHHPQHALAPRVIYVAEQGDSLIGFIAGHRTRRFGCDGEPNGYLSGRSREAVAPLPDCCSVWLAGFSIRVPGASVWMSIPRIRRPDVFTGLMVRRI